jgi:hypothetical protein
VASPWCFVSAFAIFAIIIAIEYMVEDPSMDPPIWVFLGAGLVLLVSATVTLVGKLRNRRH